MVFEEEHQEFELFVAQFELLIAIVDRAGFGVDEEFADDAWKVSHFEKLFGVIAFYGNLLGVFVNDKSMSDDNQQSVQMKFDPEMETGVYSNASSVHINGNELVLDFAYAIPRIAKDQKQTLKVVSRVNMSHSSAKSFLNILSNAILDFENKKKDHGKE